MEKKTGAIWYSGLATSKWQAGHAKRVVLCPSGSIASPSAVKRDGKKRMACSGPSRMSPIKSGCSANQSDSSGANSCQQCGQVMRERMVRRFWAIDTAVFVSSESETQPKASHIMPGMLTFATQQLNALQEVLCFLCTSPGFFAQKLNGS